MVLVETSVWIRFLTNGMPYASELDRLLDRGEAAGHDLVYGELLIGDAGGRRQLLNSYGLIERVPALSHPEVATFVRSHKLLCRGVGWIDAHLLASAIAADTSLWTADKPLARIAGELGMAYQSLADGRSLIELNDPGLPNSLEAYDVRRCGNQSSHSRARS